MFLCLLYRRFVVAQLLVEIRHAVLGPSHHPGTSVAVRVVQRLARYLLIIAGMGMREAASLNASGVLEWMVTDEQRKERPDLAGFL